MRVHILAVCKMAMVEEKELCFLFSFGLALEPHMVVPSSGILSQKHCYIPISRSISKENEKDS